MIQKGERIIAFEKVLKEYMDLNIVWEDREAIRFRKTYTESIKEIESIIRIMLRPKKRRKTAKKSTLLNDMEEYLKTIETNASRGEFLQNLLEPGTVFYSKENTPIELIIMYQADKVPKKSPYRTVRMNREEFLNSIVTITNYTHK